MNMKKVLAVILASMMTCSIAACSGGESTETQNDVSENTQTAEEQEATSGSEENEEQQTEGQDQSGDAAESSQLVAYFTYAENAELPEGVDASASASIQVWNGAVTGNTGAVAAMIAEETGADLFSIQTTETYPDSYDETVDQGQEERNQNARPELATHVENLDQYDVIFLGFPNWWGDMPMAVYSFLDEVDLSGKTIVPFVTSGGSGFSRTISSIEELEPDAEVLEGLELGASEAVDTQDEVREWVSGLAI